MPYLFDLIKRELKEAVGHLVDFSRIETPPSHVDADFAVAVKSVQDAEKAKNLINEKKFELIEKAKTIGPFLNIKLKKDAVYKGAIKEVIVGGKDYGKSKIGKGKKVFIEYSSPNIAKPMGVGHLRSTIIGEALARIYEAEGYKVHRENYLGDWGTQFGKLIYAYVQWGSKSKMNNNPIEELQYLYVRFEKEAKDNKELEQKARDIFRRLEEGDKEILKLWREFKDLSLREFDKAYKRLGIRFDTMSGESHFTKEADELIGKCIKEGICKKGKGDSVIAEIAELPTFLLRKEDGATLYLTRDLEALKFRLKKHNPDIIIYVVGHEQTLHFHQLFRLAEKLGFSKEVDARHISFGFVLAEGKKMSTRGGTAVKLESLLRQAVEKAENVVKERGFRLSEKESKRVAEAVGVGSVIYNDLRQSRDKNISFDWGKMLNFEGGSAPYLQYTYVRIQSIARRAQDTFGKGWEKDKDLIVFDDDKEFKIAKELMLFPTVVHSASTANAPHIICNYLEGLAQSFNGFYNEFSIIKTNDENLRRSRMKLAKAVAVVIKNGFEILNIQTPERM